jgi:hypothetical protein
MLSTDTSELVSPGPASAAGHALCAPVDPEEPDMFSVELDILCLLALFAFYVSKTDTADNLYLGLVRGPFGPPIVLSDASTGPKIGPRLGGRPHGPKPGLEVRAGEIPKCDQASPERGCRPSDSQCV